MTSVALAFKKNKKQKKPSEILNETNFFFFLLINNLLECWIHWEHPWTHTTTHTLVLNTKLIGREKGTCSCTDLRKQKVTVRPAVDEPSGILQLLMKLNCYFTKRPKPEGLDESVDCVNGPSANNKTRSTK